MGKQTRKTFLQYLRDKGISIKEAKALLEKIEKDEAKLTGITAKE